ncbi:TIR domain-containing protein [Burkholderia gladioli]|uniref:Thoeris protein ThsB TIR-like domain-containing protein n=1 Tax=Burkholderia gladioli (strain BSR3) TaxID=999541 RepID=F2LFI4_BURGS|nr:TIR domain-containing protein [Burkholderia gladioli]AEA61150.1 hypothetical protein bgla_1g25300 [Burkholderia gladioli BSR3]
MTRKVFYSFHYQRDGWRASKVRNIGVVEGNPPASDNKWEEVLRGGDAGIQRWIDAQLENRTCTIVLIGAETANRRWVKYEIEKSWNSGKGLFGIRIYKILDHNQQTSIAGANPFDGFSLKDGRKLSTLAKVYDPPYASSADVYNYVSKNLAGWIETAIADR